MEKLGNLIIDTLTGACKDELTGKTVFIDAVDALRLSIYMPSRFRDTREKLLDQLAEAGPKTADIIEAVRAAKKEGANATTRPDRH